MKTKQGAAGNEPHKSVIDLIRKYFFAYEAKDRKAVEELLSDDFTFTSPLDDRISKASYFARCWPNSEKTHAFHIEKLSENGDEVFVRYECEQKDGARFRNTEHFKIEEGKIKEVDVYFGRDLTAGSGEASDQAAIRAVIDAITQAVRARDVEAMLAHCAPDLATFEMVPPLKHEGVEAIRRLWTKALASFEPPMDYEVHQLEIAVSGDVAFTRSLNRFGGAQKDGERIVNWLCFTLGLRKIDGQWRVVHQHVSVPFDMETGKALLDLQP